MAINPEDILLLIDLLQVAIPLLQEIHQPPTTDYTLLHSIQTDVLAVGQAVNSGVNQVDGQIANVQSHLNGADSALQSARQDILDAVQGAAINPNAPPWYTAPPAAGPDESAIAYAVWSTPSGRQTISALYPGIPTLQLMEDIWSYISYQSGWSGVKLPQNPYFAMCVWEPWKLADTQFDWHDLTTDNLPDLPDWSAALATDTVYSFLARTQPSYGWTDTNPAGVSSTSSAWFSWGGTGDRQLWIRSNFTELDMFQLAALTPPPDPPVIPPVVINAPPVWPGAAGATLGGSSSLADQLHIVAAMDGVVVAVTTPPQHLGKYLIGGVTMDYGVGRIAFETDSGDIEPWQYLGFRTAIYTPKSMQHAAGVRFQVLGGAEGTVTPWTVTP